MKSICVCSIVVVAMLIVGCAQPVTAPATQPVSPQPPVAAVSTTAPKANPTNPPPTQPSAAIRLDQPGKCVRFATASSGGEGATLDPYNIVSGEQSFMTYQVYNSLTDIDSNFKLSPELAESWEHNATATEWTYHLRKGVKFHDGHEMTSKDVVWTFKQLINPEVKSEAAALLAFLKPEGIIAVDDYTVMFKADKPVVEMDLTLASKNMKIIPNGAKPEDLKFTGNGTGPWVPVDYKPGQSPHIMRAFADYWKKGYPKTECAEVYVIPEEATRMAALQSGQIDLTAVGARTVAPLQKDPGIKVIVGPPSNFETFSMWVDTKPFNDIRVRQALKKVIDRKAMVNTLLLGYGEVGDDNPIPPSWPNAWRPGPPARDVDGAKKLLAEAGYGPSNPLKLDLYTAEYATAFVSKSEMFRQQAAEAGIVVNVIVGPASEYWSNVWLKQPFLNSTWSLRPTAEGLALNYRLNSKNKETHWERTDYDALLDKAAAEPDEAKRTEIYKQAQKMLAEEGGIIVPFFVKNIYALRSNCDGFTVHVQTTHIDISNLVCKR